MRRRVALGIGYVPQGGQIFPLLTLEENLQIGLPAQADGNKKIPGPIFELFPVLEEVLGRCGGLSGGQQQQLAIDRALVLESGLLILDEPTEGIQPVIVQEIGDIIRRLSREIGLTVILVVPKLLFARNAGDGPKWPPCSDLGVRDLVSDKLISTATVCIQPSAIGLHLFAVRVAANRTKRVLCQIQSYRLMSRMLSFPFIAMVGQHFHLGASDADSGRGRRPSHRLGYRDPVPGMGIP